MRAGSTLPTEATVVEPYGATLTVGAPDAELLGRIVDGLPRGWTGVEPDRPSHPVAGRFSLLRDARGYRIRDPGGGEAASGDVELAISMLRTKLRRAAASHHRERICLRAGVVVHLDRAILLPGTSLIGTSTLVEALVRAGAEYHSDELAIFAEDGTVAVSGAASTSGISPRGSVPVGLVAFTVYQPGFVWSPRRLTPGEALVALLSAGGSAQDRPREALATLRRALVNAKVLEGPRGPADETAAMLLSMSAAPD